MQSRFFRARDGLRLHYLSHPCTQAESASYCILLHGFTNDAHVWDGLVGALQAKHHVLALDQRGHGDSDWDPARKYSHWQLAEDLQDFLVSLGDATVHIVGHSLGARVAILALESMHHSVTSLTIVDAGPEVSPEAGERLVNDVMQLPEHHADVQAYLDCLARIYVMADTEALARLASFGLRVKRGRLMTKTDPAFTPGIWHKSPEFRRLDKEKGELSVRLWRALGALTLPVHIVRGQASSILEHSLALKMVQVLGDRGLLSVVPRAGHAVMLDNPVKSAALIAQFIQNAASETGVTRIEKELESRV
ncbi:alpha/beta fold hydrolase [Pseudohongiella sp.]|uniref:AB hydrolase-1 domain-containing protein n=1 Tax=marine sediment metagenome TaxID=412755 RepID=A0A0F9WJU5_9ZZZZ|nr:alpha/beta hydrolase [Pseudohongiella sp.]HDZ08108.1 alpha/beta hydrolase [Pseudohongiella sp.]HEA63076.1 alpha/beta hydrolase [Pseudohongiella sp.]